MSDYFNNALYGSNANPGYLDATMMNGNAAGPDDWATVASQGLQAIIRAKIQDKQNEVYQDYVRERGMVSVQTSGDGMNLLLLIGLAVFLMKD